MAPTGCTVDGSGMHSIGSCQGIVYGWQVACYSLEQCTPTNDHQRQQRQQILTSMGENRLKVEKVDVLDVVDVDESEEIGELPYKGDFAQHALHNKR
jgi:hypothetical protein